MGKFARVATSLLGLCFLTILESAANFPGHLQPLGLHQPPEKEIAEVHGAISPRDFYSKSMQFSRPVILRKAVEGCPAAQLWKDDYLREHYGQLEFKTDVAKKEQLVIKSTRLFLSDFLNMYNESQYYIVDQLPTEMRGEMPLIDCLQCGGFTSQLQEMLFWFSSGNTTSSFHFDTFDNVNCQIDGTKHWFIIDKKEGDLHASLVHGEVPMEEFDVDAVDMNLYPQFRNIPWWSALINPGDCIYVPYKWFHYVRSYGRNLAVNVWWTPLEDLDDHSCKETEKMASGKLFLSDVSLTPAVHVRFLMTEMIRNNDGHVTLERSKFLFVSEGVSLITDQIFNDLDGNGDGLLTIDEVNQTDLQFFHDHFHVKPTDINIHGAGHFDSDDSHENGDDDLDAIQIHNEL